LKNDRDCGETLRYINRKLGNPANRHKPIFGAIHRPRVRRSCFFTQPILFSLP